MKPTITKTAVDRVKYPAWQGFKMLFRERKRLEFAVHRSMALSRKTEQSTVISDKIQSAFGWYELYNTLIFILLTVVIWGFAGYGWYLLGPVLVNSSFGV